MKAHELSQKIKKVEKEIERCHMRVVKMSNKAHDYENEVLRLKDLLQHQLTKDANA